MSCQSPAVFTLATALAAAELQWHRLPPHSVLAAAHTGSLLNHQRQLRHPALLCQRLSCSAAACGAKQPVCALHACACFAPSTHLPASCAAALPRVPTSFPGPAAPVFFLCCQLSALRAFPAVPSRLRCAAFTSIHQVPLVYTNSIPRKAASIVTSPPAAPALDAPLVLFRVIGVRIGSASPESLNTGSGAGGGGAGGWNFMFWRQPQAPKKMPFATTSPHTSASTTSSVWLALSATLRFSGDSQCTRSAVLATF